MPDVLGQAGSKTISGTGAIVPDAGKGEFSSIQALTALTFTAATAAPGDDWFDLTTAPIPAGSVVHGSWSSITPASGTGIAYY